MMTSILTLQYYQNEILILQQYSIYNVLNIAIFSCFVFVQYFRNLYNSFVNIFAIFQDFDGIFLKYSFNITVLCGLDSYCWSLISNSIQFWTSILTILNYNYTNSYYLFLIVELLTVNSNF